DGYLKKVGNALDRMGELAVLAQDTTKSSTDLALYDKEFAKLQTFISDTEGKEFNGVKLLDGTAIKVTQDEDGTAYTMSGVDLDGGDYKKVVDRTNANAALQIKVDTAANAATALAQVKLAITELAEDRADVGADQSVLQNISSTMSVLKDNLGAANSRIKDVDVAEESANFARQNILVQSGTAMLAQANALPQSALRLIG
ncbi:flagellin, partial [Verrucomicrobia bacterium]|nr:flagellin [Verrucomicrobiota bacterium]